MRAALNVWGSALARSWLNLPKLIVSNLAWLVLSWPLVTLGAATIALYAWLRRAVLEREASFAAGQPKADEPYVTLLRDVGARWWPGTLWLLANLLVALLTTAHLRVWSVQLAPLGEAVAIVMVLYAVWFWAAMQPFWLDALAEGVRPRAGLVEAARIVAAYPLYAHACALPPLLLVAVGFWLRSFWPLVGVSVLLLYWGHVATADPRGRPGRRYEELL